MIPVLLKFQAFESYVEEQTVDFEKLSAGGLFLINGETGAGKSAILDAMTYALYGVTSGGAREEVRCLYASAASVPTKVEFTFDIGKERYRFTREIRRKKRAEGFDIDQNFLKLENGVFVSKLANPTKTAVAEQAEKLLGLSVSQFRQIVVLPQGQFEKFLVSDSKDKEEILTTLFHAEDYTQISNNLAATANERNKAVKSKQDELAGLLKGFGFSDISELGAHRAGLSAQNKTSAKQLAVLTKEADTAEKLLEAAKLLMNSFSLMDKETARHGELLSQTNEIKASETRLERGKSALKLSEPFKLRTAAEKEFSARKSQLSTAENQCKTLFRELKAAEAERSELEKQKSEQEQSEQELLSLKNSASVYEEISKARAEEKSADERLKSALSEQKKTEEQFQRNSALEEALSAEIDEIKTKFSAKIPFLQAEKVTLEGGRKKLDEISLCTSELKKLRDTVEALSLKTKAAKAQLQAREEEFDRAYSEQLSDFAAALAEKLSDGAPCPVCGSVHHPLPFRSSHENAIGAKELDKLKEAVRAAKETYDKASALQDKGLSSIERGELKIKDLTEELERSGYSDERYSAVCEELSAAEAENKKLPALAERLSAAKSITAELALRKSSLAARVLEATGLYSEKRSRAEMLAGQQRADIPDLAALNEKISVLEKKITLYKNKSAEVSEQCGELSVKYASAEATLSLAKNELEKSETAMNKASEEFLTKLSEQDFADAEEWQKNLADEQALSALEEKINSYKATLAACESRLHDLSEQLDGKARPDLDKLTESFAELKAQQSELAEKLAVSRSEEKRLDDFRENYENESRLLEDEIAEAAEFSAFAALFQGSKGQSFTRYVLGTMLSMITAEANRLLADVHGGQFRIYRKTEGLGNNRRTGLELEVQSAMAAEPYSVKNLSGGEKFLVSLAMSMALSSILQSMSGGISIEAMFIDEGFGTLDDKSRKEALDILIRAAGNRRTVGIISHVTELKELLHNQILVTKDSGGSRLKMIF